LKLAQGMMDMSELNPDQRQTLMKYLQTGGAGMDPAQVSWCAAFVNSSLQQAGIKGSGSNVATSFGAWGEAVKGSPQAGDVMVQMRGHRVGETGGHVGFATGNTRVVNGQLQYEMLGGNQSDRVGNKWVPASDLTVRRAPISTSQAAPPQPPIATVQPPEAATPQQTFGAGVDVNKLPPGMRNQNPANIQYTGSKFQRANFPGIVGPSENLDVSKPQIVFSSAQAGMKSAATLAGSKYGRGMKTLNQIIAGKSGWTPGNMGAVKNIAKIMGIAPDADLNLNDPVQMNRFMHALVRQEQGASASLYPESLYQQATGQARATAAGVPSGGDLSPGATSQGFSSFNRKLLPGVTRNPFDTRGDFSGVTAQGGDVSAGATSQGGPTFANRPPPTALVASLKNRPSPLELQRQEQREVQLGTGKVMVTLKAPGLEVSQPRVEGGSKFDVGLAVDNTGAVGLTRPGDPTYAAATSRTV